MLFENAGGPLAAHTHATGNAYRLVDDEQLPVIARDEPEPASKTGLVEYLKVDAGADKLANKGPGGPASANPIQKHSYRDSSSGGSGQRVAEAAPHLV